MPLKRGDQNKRYVSSDSEDASSIYETPKKGSHSSGAKRQHTETTMVAETNNLDIRMFNGKVNGLQVDHTNLGPNMTPVVVLNDINAQLKRKSFGFTSNRVTPIAEMDEREERRIRQTERAAQHRRSAVGLVSTPNRVPAQTSVVMSADKLKEHYTHCIQLSATNKINIKNAFGLHLIDYMSELIKQAEHNQAKGFVNFKLAGTALDAGAKIYCHRVDSVHAEAQKVASSLVMALNTDKKANNNEDDNQNEEGMEGIDEDNEGTNNQEANRPKRKKTKKNVKTIAQNIETLNIGRVEANLEIDPVFHHLSAAFDMGNVNSLLMANLKVNPSGLLLLDSNSSVNFDNQPIITDSRLQTITKFYDVLNDISKSSAQICPKLSSFEFLNRDNGIDLIQREEDPSFARRDDFAFDLNADVEDIEEEFEDHGLPDGFDNHYSDSDSDGGGLEAADATVKKSMSRSLNMQGVGDLVKMLSEKPNDYSYFNPKLLGAWAGPNHWKRIPFRRDRLDGAPGGVDGDKPRRQRRQFPEFDYTQIDESIVENLDQMCPQMLKISTLNKWKSNHIELRLPADHGFDPKSLTTSFIKKETTFYCAKQNNEEVMENTMTSNHSYGAPASPGVERYDYDDDDDMPMGGFTDPLELGHSVPLSTINANANEMAFIGDNLVEQPYDLQQYNITFAKFAKKMDVKKLKRAMWDVISPIQEIETPVLPEVCISSVIRSLINII